MAARVNLYVDQGIDFSATLELTLDNGQLFDVSNKSFYCEAKKLYSTTPIFSANVSIISGDPTNDLLLVINGEDTKNLEPGKYQYDVVMISNSSSLKILEGLIFLVPTITSLP